MNCDERKKQLANLAIEPDESAIEHLDQCPMCRKWFDKQIQQPLHGFSPSSAEPSPEVWKRIVLPLESRESQPDSFWERLYAGFSLGAMVIGILLLTMSGPHSGPVTLQQPVRTTVLSFLTGSNSLELKCFGPSDLSAVAGFMPPEQEVPFLSESEVPLFDVRSGEEWTFLDADESYTFIEEEQS